jgi:DNA-binding transcriptional LysR family regulator
LRDLARDPWVTVSRGMGAGFHQQTLELCLRAGFTPEVAMEAGEIQTVVGLVAAGIGVALVPSMVTSVHRRGVVYVELGAPRATVELAIAYHRERPSPVLENLLCLVDAPTKTAPIPRPPITGE